MYLSRPSPIISVFRIVWRGKQKNFLNRGIGNFAGGIFFQWWESDKEWFWRFEPVSKLKTRFRKYWTSIKIKISMTCMYKDYKFKIKMVQEQWLQLKMREATAREFFLVGGWTKFWLIWGLSFSASGRWGSSPSTENPDL